MSVSRVSCLKYYFSRTLIPPWCRDYMANLNIVIIAVAQLGGGGPKRSTPSPHYYILASEIYLIFELRNFPLCCSSP